MVELFPEFVTVSEGAGTVELCVNVTKPSPSVDISLSFFIDITTANSTAGNHDYRIVSRYLIIAGNFTSVML